MLDEPSCLRHHWHDVADTMAPTVLAMIGHWPGVELMQIGHTYACWRCQARVTIEAAGGSAAWPRWKDSVCQSKRLTIID